MALGQTPEAMARSWLDDIEASLSPEAQRDRPAHPAVIAEAVWQVCSGPLSQLEPDETAAVLGAVRRFPTPVSQWRRIRAKRKDRVVRASIRINLDYSLLSGDAGEVMYHLAIHTLCRRPS